MLYDNIIKIKKDLSNHHRDRNTLKFIYVQNRLNKSLQSYYSDLSKSALYLETKRPDNVLHKL